MKKSNGQSGAAIVEFSLVFMLFLVLSIGLFEMGRAMWIYTTLSHAARQGARFAMVRGTNALTPPPPLLRTPKSSRLSATTRLGWLQLTLPSPRGGNLSQRKPRKIGTPPPAPAKESAARLLSFEQRIPYDSLQVMCF